MHLGRWAGCRFDLRHNSLQHVTYQILSLTSFLFHIIKRSDGSVFNSGIMSASGKIPFLVLYIRPRIEREMAEILLYKIWKKKNMKFVAFVPLSTPVQLLRFLMQLTNDINEPESFRSLPVRSGASRRLGLMDPFEQWSETKQEKKECRPQKG